MIFISYSQKDSTQVNKIVNSLRDDGNRIWIDYERLDLKKPIKGQIKEAISNCEKFILFKSQNSINSVWVKYELNTALKIIPLNKIQLIKLSEI